MQNGHGWRERWSGGATSSGGRDDPPRLTKGAEQTLDGIRRQLDVEYGEPLAGRYLAQQAGWGAEDDEEDSSAERKVREARGRLASQRRRPWKTGAALVAGCAIATLVLVLLLNPAKPPETAAVKAPAATRPAQSPPAAPLSRAPDAPPGESADLVLVPAVPPPALVAPAPAPAPEVSAPRAPAGPASPSAPPPTPSLNKAGATPKSGAPRTAPAPVTKRPPKPKAPAPELDPIPAPRRFSAEPATSGPAGTTPARPR